MGILGCQMWSLKQPEFIEQEFNLDMAWLENLDVDLFHALMFHSPYLIM